MASRNNPIFGDEDAAGSRPNIATRQNNFFNRASESPIMTAGTQIVRGNSGGSTANLPVLGKQNNTLVSVNDTRDTINAQENSRRSSQGFSTKRPKMGEADFDYSTLNLNLRLRDLESKMVDIKGDMERRLLQIIEESPMKFLQQLKHIEDKETTLWADNMEKHNRVSEALAIQNNRATGHLENVGQRLIQMQKQIENLSFKNVELERNIGNLTRHNRDLLDNNMNALEIKQQAGRDVMDLAGELRLLKDRVGNQEESKIRFFRDVSSQVEALNAVVLKNENDLYSRLRDQKKQLLDEAFSSKDQLKKIEEMRMEKILGDNEYMKSLMDSLERKVKNEMSKRLTSEYDQKSWLELHLHNFKDEIKNDQKDMLENQNNLVREVQESISSINTIIRNTREEMMATTNSNQLLMTENMRNLTKALEVVKDNLLQRVAGLDSNLFDLNKRMDLTNQAFNENTIKVTQALENEATRVDRIMNRFEDLVTESNKNLNDRITQSEEKHEAWRKEYEDKNHNIFKEMNNALKSLKKQIVKVHKDSGERDKDLEKQIVDAKILSEGMFKNLDEKCNHLENIYGFKLDESTKVWAHNLQMEVDKILDAISRNTEVVQGDFGKRLNGLRSDLNNKMHDTVDKEAARLRGQITEAKRDVEDLTLNKIKDVEVRLENLFKHRFEDQRNNLDGSIREFNRLKNELELIKKDYHGAVDAAREDAKEHTRKEVDGVKTLFVDRLKENKEQIDDLFESRVRNMKQEIDLNKEDMLRSVQAAKLDIQSELQTSANDLKNMVDKNDQIIHSDVNNKMNSLNTEITTTKKFLVERMDEIHESTKSLARALVNEEAANRANKDEMIIKLFDRKVANLNNFVTSMVEQKLDEMRIGLENKIRDLMVDQDDFKRWVMDEFSNVRTEAEYFKQEYYARDYTDYLYFLTFQDQMASQLDDVQKQFYETNSKMEKIKESGKNTGTKLEKMIKEEAEERKEEHEDYKKLNERTWEEMLLMYNADLVQAKCNLGLVEAAVFESINRIIKELGNMGGDQGDLEKQLQQLNNDAKKFREKVAKQDKENDGRFKDIENDAKELGEHYKDFQKVTKNNFQITEEALSVLSNLINSIDSRMTGESLVNMATFQLMEQRTAAEIAEMDGRMRLTDKETKKKIEEDLKKQEKKIVEDYIPTQLLAINQAMGDMQQKNSANVGKVSEMMQQKISEHSITLEDHTKTLKEHAQRIKFAEENISDAGNDMKKIEEAVHSTNAHILHDGLSQQAEVGLLKQNISLTIQEIYGVLAKMGQGDDGTTFELARVKDKVGKIDTRFEELSKRLDRVDKENKDDVGMKDFKELQKEVTEIRKRLDKVSKDNEDDVGQKDFGALQKEVESIRKKLDKVDKENKDDVGVADFSELAKEVAEIKKKLERVDKENRDDVGMKDFKELQKDVAETKKKLERVDKDNKDDVGMKDFKALQKEVTELKEEMESLRNAGGSAKGGSTNKTPKDGKDGKDGADSKDFKALQKQVAQLQKSISELEERVVELEIEEEREDLEEAKAKRKGKAKKDDKDDDEDNADLDKLEERLNERIDELREELIEKMNEKDDEVSAKDKKGIKKSEPSTNTNSERFEVMEERMKELEDRVEELAEKRGSKGDDDDENKGGVSEDRVNELEEELNKKIDELEERLKEVEEKGDDKGDDKESKDNDNQKIWEEIAELKEKVEEIDAMNEKISNIEERLEKLEDKE